MLRELTEKEVEAAHKKTLKQVKDILDDKYGSFAYNMLNSLLSGLMEMDDELRRYAKEKDRQIDENRKMLGMPPRKKK